MRKIAAIVICLTLMYGVIPSFAETVKQLQKRAKAGDSQAQYDLAAKYYQGDGVKKNHAEAFRWWLSAAKNGHAESQRIVGDLYISGDGVKQNKAEGFKWIMRSAENGNAAAQMVVAAAYDLGNADYGVKQNQAEAKKWYQRAANSPNAAPAVKKSAENLIAAQGKNLEAQKKQDAAQKLQDASQRITEARKYYTGDGVPQNKAKAREIYRQLADEGNVQGQFLLAQSYKDDKNYTEAAKWYLKSAEQGYSMSQSNLAEMYFKGEGVPKNYSEATKWYRMAADKNDSNSQFAQYHLAEMYVNGYGVEQNYTEAVNLYRKAAARDFVPALHKLGMMYHNGYGVPKNYAEAVKYYKKAAEKNYPPAESSLGDMYFNGEGVQKDEKTALDLWEKAAAKGDLKAKNALSTYAKAGKETKTTTPARDLEFDDDSRTVTAEAGIDVPDFADFGQDLGFGGDTESNGYTYYSYYCDVTSNKDAAEKYVAELTDSYDFVETAHEYNDGGRVGNRRLRRGARANGITITESWFFRYTGSKYAQSFETGRRNNEHTCHLAVLMTRDTGTDSTSFRILVADGLVYGAGENSQVITASAPVRSSSSSSSRPSAPRKPSKIECIVCYGTGKVKCSACDGTGHRVEYIHVPRFVKSRAKTERKVFHKCSKCKGTREMDCVYCRGSGYI